MMLSLFTIYPEHMTGDSRLDIIPFKGKQKHIWSSDGAIDDVKAVERRVNNHVLDTRVITI